MAVNSDIAHRLLDILSVVMIAGLAYFVLRITATDFGTGERVTVLTILLGASVDKLGFRLLHGKVK